MSLRERYGDWALIAGGSEGVGESFARQLAAQGFNLVLLARKSAQLDALAQSIRADTGREVRTPSLDLSRADALAKARRPVAANARQAAASKAQNQEARPPRRPASCTMHHSSPGKATARYTGAAPSCGCCNWTRTPTTTPAHRAVPCHALGTVAASSTGTWCGGTTECSMRRC